MISQICSCHPDTVAIYKNSDGKTFDIRVECWAVWSDHAVVGMVRDNGGCLSRADTPTAKASFVCYANGPIKNES